MDLSLVTNNPEIFAGGGVGTALIYKLIRKFKSDKESDDEIRFHDDLRDDIAERLKETEARADKFAHEKNLYFAKTGELEVRARDLQEELNRKDTEIAKLREEKKSDRTSIETISRERDDLLLEIARLRAQASREKKAPEVEVQHGGNSTANQIRSSGSPQGTEEEKGSYELDSGTTGIPEEASRGP